MLSFLLRYLSTRNLLFFESFRNADKRKLNKISAIIIVARVQKMQTSPPTCSELSNPSKSKSLKDPSFRAHPEIQRLNVKTLSQNSSAKEERIGIFSPSLFRKFILFREEITDGSLLSSLPFETSTPSAKERRETYIYTNKYEKKNWSNFVLSVLSSLQN